MLIMKSACWAKDLITNFELTYRSFSLSHIHTCSSTILTYHVLEVQNPYLAHIIEKPLPIPAEKKQYMDPLKRNNEFIQCLNTINHGLTGLTY